MTTLLTLPLICSTAVLALAALGVRPLIAAAALPFVVATIRVIA